MKFNFKTILVSALALASVACSKSAIDELTGVYSAPVEVNLADAKCEVVAEPQGDFTYLTVSITGKENIVLKFASKKYYLFPTTYYLNAAEGIKAGMFLAGESKVNGKAITFGSVTVDATALDEDETNFDLRIYGVVETGENVRADIDWAGTVTFEKPKAAGADYIFVDTQGAAAGQDGAAVEGVVKHSLALYQGENLMGGLELVTATGADIAGHYDVMSYPNAAGKAGNGYYMDLSSMGWGIIKGGSYLIIEGVFTGLDEGVSIEVALDKATGFYHVTTSTGLDFTMDAYVEPLVMTMTNNPSSVTDESNAAVEGFDRWDVQLKKDDAIVAAFDLVVPTGAEWTGEYTVAGYPHADHIAGNGWGFAAWNYFGGTRFADGENWIFVNPGSKFTVTANADGTYTFAGVDCSLKSSVDGSADYTGNFKFKGKLAE